MHEFDFSIPLFITRVQGTCIVVTTDIVSDVLHVPKVEHLDYPGCDHLKIMSKDELISAFCNALLIGMSISSFTIRALLKALGF